MSHVLFHALGDPWVYVSHWIRVNHGYKPAVPVPQLARALGFHKLDILHVMNVEKIPRAPFSSYIERGIYVEDLPRLFRAPLLQLKWSEEQIAQAMSYLRKSKGSDVDEGQSSFRTLSRGRRAFKRRFFPEGEEVQEQDKEEEEEEDEAVSSSLDALAAEASLRRTEAPVAAARKREREHDDILMLPTYPPEWQRLLSDQIRGVHDSAMCAFRGQPNYEELKRAKREEIKAELRLTLRADAVSALEARAKREAIQEHVSQRRAEISQRVQHRSAPDLFFSFHLPGEK